VSEIPKDHPRYKSLVTREKLADGVKEGMADPTGLISQGRGEAFDYLMGERTLEPARHAEKVAAAMLLRAENPVVCMNGNSVVLDPEGLIALAEAVPAKMEVNLFHRTPERMEKLISYMESKGAEHVLGRDPDTRIPGLHHDRALCTMEGVGSSDVIVVPIEDGDRAEALVAMGKKVISIDLNPLSRTSRTATVPISDEISRALANITAYAKELKGNEKEIDRLLSGYSAKRTREEELQAICDHLMSEFRSE
jgi:4-phosphopantoate--beta-alanine ligase